MYKFTENKFFPNLEKPANKSIPSYLTKFYSSDLKSFKSYFKFTPSSCIIDLPNNGILYPSSSVFNL